MLSTARAQPSPGVPSSTSASSACARDAVATFTARLEAGLAREPDLGERLAFAETTVCLRAGEHAAVTLLLDRIPPEVRLGEEPAEIGVDLSPESLAQLANGELLLPLTLLAGQGSHRGPVRRLLALSPILCSLLAAGAARKAGR